MMAYFKPGPSAVLHLYFAFHTDYSEISCAIVLDLIEFCHAHRNNGPPSVSWCVFRPPHPDALTDKDTVACLALSNVCLALQADIHADSNRDGKVDISAKTDSKDKLECTNEMGAICLVNIGDTDRRCSELALEGPPLLDEALAACNDASDDIQRSPDYLAPLRTMPIEGLIQRLVVRFLSTRRLRERMYAFSTK